MAKILIFEDNLDLALYWQRLLEAEQHSIQCCANVSAALALVEKTKPDLIIIDMLLKMDGTILPEGGLTLMSQLQISGLAKPRLLGVSGMRRSAYLHTTALEIAEKMGIDLALYKPISAEQLLEAVTYLLTS